MCSVLCFWLVRKGRESQGAGCQRRRAIGSSGGSVLASRVTAGVPATAVVFPFASVPRPRCPVGRLRFRNGGFRERGPAGTTGKGQRRAEGGLATTTARATSSPWGSGVVLPLGSATLLARAATATGACREGGPGGRGEREQRPLGHGCQWRRTRATGTRTRGQQGSGPAAGGAGGGRPAARREREPMGRPGGCHACRRPLAVCPSALLTSGGGCCSAGGLAKPRPGTERRNAGNASLPTTANRRTGKTGQEAARAFRLVALVSLFPSSQREESVPFPRSSPAGWCASVPFPTGFAALLTPRQIGTRGQKRPTFRHVPPFLSVGGCVPLSLCLACPLCLRSPLLRVAGQGGVGGVCGRNGSGTRGRRSPTFLSAGWCEPLAHSRRVANAGGLPKATPPTGGLLFRWLRWIFCQPTCPPSACSNGATSSQYRPRRPPVGCSTVQSAFRRLGASRCRACPRAEGDAGQPSTLSVRNLPAAAFCRATSRSAIVPIHFCSCRDRTTCRRKDTSGDCSKASRFAFSAFAR